MRRLTFLPVVLLLTLPVALAVLLCTTQDAWAAPAWGGNCLSCHAQMDPSPLVVTHHDFLADPNESGTGAPDRGTLKVFYGFRGRTNRLQAQIAGLVPDDAYAVELTRLRYRGVVSNGTLAYFPDCSWPEWGEPAGYYTDQVISYPWGAGPTEFTFNLEVEPNAARDYYDLVLAVGGKFADDGSLFYGEEHFYLQVLIAGDLNDDGHNNAADVTLLAPALGGPDITTPPPGCNPLAFSRGDLDDDEDVDLADFAQFQAAYSGS